MSTQLLTYTPVRDGYTFDPGYNSLEISLESRSNRKRQDVLYNTHRVSVNWTLTNATDYTRFMGFFRTTLQNGTLSFRMNLVTDISVPTLHKCRSLQGLPRLSAVKSLSYYVNCVLEVEANPTYTGLIRYLSPTIALDNDSPNLTEGFRVGDSIRIVDSTGIHPTSGTVLNLDGTYPVVSTTGFSTVTITPSGSGWTTLAGLSPNVYGDAGNGNVTSTVTRVPT